MNKKNQLVILLDSLHPYKDHYLKLILLDILHPHKDHYLTLILLDILHPHKDHYLTLILSKFPDQPLVLIQLNKLKKVYLMDQKKRLNLRAYFKEAKT